MARKKKEQKKKKEIPMQVENGEISEEKVPKKIAERENRPLLWFFIIVGVIIASVLISYFYVQSSKTFDLAGAEWIKEKYPDFEIYHGRFPVYWGDQLVHNYNIFLRNDPRKNDIPADIDVSLYPNVIVTQSPEVWECEKSILVSDLLGKTKTMLPMVIGNLTGATTDRELAEERGLPFADCSSESGKTVILVQMAEESSVMTDPNNPDCYIINIGKCEENLKAAEKFMIEVVSQWNNADE